jgi:ABC-type sugar transport system ATPase subunit
MKIISADRRLTECRGAKILAVGPTGVGKTSLLRTLGLSTTLFIDIEAGDLAVQDLVVDTLRPRTWPECRDLAAVLTGANPALPDSACYSAGHYAAAREQFGDPEV